jgi:hypothetical protein
MPRAARKSRKELIQQALFNSFALPTSFDLSRFDPHVFNIYMGTEDKPVHFYGMVDTTALVPEPATLLLMGLGVFLLHRRRD